MGAFLIRRLVQVIQNVWAVVKINCIVVQIAPGGRVGLAIAAIECGNAGV